MPKAPTVIYNVRDAAKLAQSWPGVRKAEFVSVCSDRMYHDLVVVHFWPWVMGKSRRLLIRDLVITIHKRNVHNINITVVRGVWYKRYKRLAPGTERRMDHAERN